MAPVAALPFILSAVARPAAEYLQALSDKQSAQAAAKLPHVGVPVEAGPETIVYVLAKHDYEFPLPAAIASHLGPFKLRRIEDPTAAGGWRAATANDRPVYDAANGMSDAILRWNNGFWLVSPAKTPLNESKAHLNIADDARLPWQVGHPSWAVVKQGVWARHWIDVYTGAVGREEFEAQLERVGRAAFGGAPSLELRGTTTHGGSDSFPHLQPIYGNYTRNEGQIHLQRPVFTSANGRYVMHYDVSGAAGAWLISYTELFNTHDAVLQVTSEAVLPELIEGDATWKGENHARNDWAPLPDHRFSLRPRAAPQNGPGLIEDVDGFSEWPSNDTAAAADDGCRAYRWRTPEEARTARAQRRVYSSVMSLAGSIATVALWAVGAFLALKAM